MPPPWLISLANVFLISAGLSALVIVVDILSGQASHIHATSGMQGKPLAEKTRRKRFWQEVMIGDTHCGAGCTLGDILAEWGVYFMGLSVAGSVLWASYVWDFILAYVLGIIFQYYTIAPMRNLWGWPGIKAAIKADTISLTAFEVGLFTWMALSQKVFFHPALQPINPVYWFMMQVGMVIGFITSYPANWWLIRNGFKEVM